MKGLLRKLVISVLSICFSFIVLGTVTFAWITMTTSNTTDGLTLSISSGEELQFSLDGINYYNKLSSDIVMSMIPNLSFKDVTSMDGKSFAVGGPRSTDIAIKNVDYFSITFWVRTTGLEHYLYLIDNVNHLVEYDLGRDGTYVVSRGVSWRADQTFINGTNENDIIRSGEQAIYYASKAVRISFVEEKDTLNVYDNRGLNELKTFIYDPSEDSVRSYGANFGAVDYFNMKMGQNVLPPDNKPVTIYKLSHFAPNNPYTPNNGDSRIMQLIQTDNKDLKNQTYYSGKVTINVWLEGWDADCFDAIHRDSIKVQLKFKVGKFI